MSTLREDQPAITLEPHGLSLTRRQFEEQTAQFARALLALGLEPGCSVAWLVENRLEFVVIAVGAQRGGFDYLALNTHSNPAEIASILTHLRPQVIVASGMHLMREGMQEALASLDPTMRRIVIGEAVPGWLSYATLLSSQLTSWEEVEADVPGSSLLLSGGSTGCPKVIKRSGDMGGAITAFSPGEGDVQLVPQPLYHTGPLTIMMMALQAGAHVVVLERWSNTDALRAIQQHQVTHVFFVPAMMAYLVGMEANVRARYDISSLRLVTHGAAPCPVEVKWQWLNWMPPGCVTVEAYGMSENFGMTAIGDAQWRQKPGSVGQPVGCRIVIRDKAGTALPVGETGIVWFVREDGATMEYLGNPEETRGSYAVRDGYLEGTAFDMGYLDEDGFLFLNGRDKDMIICGGANIYPVQTENALHEHPAVEDVAVVGMPDDILGQVLVAFVQCRAGTDEGRLDILQKELIEFCRDRLGAYHAPRRIVFGPLPRLETGKINKRQLAELVS